MPIDLPLNDMTLAEKLEAMELLWADLSRQSERLESPVWHLDILAQRRLAVERGEEKFLDWNVAMNDLRKEVQGNRDS